VVWTVVFIAAGATVLVETVLADDLRRGHFDATNSTPILSMPFNGLEAVAATITLWLELDGLVKLIEPFDASHQTVQTFVVGKLVPGTLTIEVRQFDFIRLITELLTELLFGIAAKHTAAEDVVELAIPIKVGVIPFPDATVIPTAMIGDEHVTAKSLVVWHVVSITKVVLVSTHNKQVSSLPAHH